MRKFHISHLLKNQAGMSLAEVMIGFALAGALSVVMMKINETGTHGAKNIQARNTIQTVQGMIESALSVPAGCSATLTPVVTTANHANNITSTGTTVPNIRNHTTNVIMTSTSKIGEIKLTDIRYQEYSSTTQLAYLVVSGTYKLGKVTKQIKKIRIPINMTLDGANNLSSCASSSSGENDIWKLMTVPSLGIYYNAGSVLIGSGSADTLSALPSVAMGTNNNTTAPNSLVVGTDNNLLTEQVSIMLGNQNQATSGGLSAYIIGEQNMIMGGASGILNKNFMLGAQNTIHGEDPIETIMIGFNNTIHNAPTNMMFGRDNAAHGTSTNSVMVGGNNAVHAGTSYLFGSNNNANVNSYLFGLGNTSTGTAGGLALGNTNSVSGLGAIAIGTNNTLSTVSDGSVAIATSNNITNSKHSVAGGLGNTINITTGSVGGSGPLASIAFGRANNVTGSEAHAYGYGNTVRNRFAIAVGTGNDVGGSAGTAVGTWNVVGASNATAIGYYAEANAASAMGLGSYVKSNGTGAMTLGDASTSTYLVNTTNNSLAARFDGGYSFYTDTGLSSTAAMYLNSTGQVGIGKTPSYKLDVGTGGSRITVTSGVGSGVAITANYGNVVTPPDFAPTGDGPSTEILRLGGSLRMAGFYNAGAKTGTIFFGNKRADGRDANLTYWETSDYWTWSPVSGRGLVLSTHGNIGIGGWPNGAIDIKTLSGTNPYTGLAWTAAEITASEQAYKPGGGSFTASSDKRLKKNIKSFSGALEKINQLKPVHYEWINPELHGIRKTEHGFIAQDVEKIFPQWVVEYPSRGDNADSLIVPKGQNIKAITFPFSFNAYIVKALQELDQERKAKAAQQDKEIDSLKRSMATLQAENEDLRARLDRLEAVMLKKMPQ